MRALLLIPLLLAACGDVPPVSMAADSTRSAQTSRVGRLLVDLPASAARVPGSNGGTHDWTPIREEPWPEGLAPSGQERDRARDDAWDRVVADAQARLDGERRSARNRGMDADALVLDARPVEVAGADWARALRWPSYSGRDVSVVVVADHGPVRLVTDKKVSAGKADASLDRFVDVLGAYVPAGAPGDGGRDWLYLRYGAVARAPAGYEVAAATFDGPAPFADVVVSMQTRLVPPDGPSLVERFRQAQGSGLRRLLGPVLPGGLDAGLREIRAGRRPAGALDGEEVVTEVRAAIAEGAGDAGTSSVIELEWEHRGTPEDGRDPDVTVKASTPPGPPPSPEQEAAVLAAWDALLQSLRLTSAPR